MQASYSLCAVLGVKTFVHCGKHIVGDPVANNEGRNFSLFCSLL